ncbi:MAG TPA: DUF433 domain-containing protein [Spirochaetota bacterium]|jgi:uncharacterized protein (DUF433 family)|nr:DUF433 domain-containing protein [Spirochaetota bacterium]
MQEVRKVTKFDRITFDENIMNGQACIRGMRITVSLILNLIANNKSFDDIIQDYPYIKIEDIRQSLKYAAF